MRRRFVLGIFFGIWLAGGSTSDPAAAAANGANGAPADLAALRAAVEADKANAPERSVATLRSYAAAHPGDPGLAALWTEVAKTAAASARLQTRKYAAAAVVPAIKAYEALAEAMPHTEAAAEALLAAGELYERDAHDTARASYFYARAEAQSPGSEAAARVHLKLAALGRSTTDGRGVGLELLARVIDNHAGTPLEAEARFLRADFLLLDPTKREAFREELSTLLQSHPADPRTADLVRRARAELRKHGSDADTRALRADLESRVAALPEIGASDASVRPGKALLLEAAALEEEGRDHAKAKVLLEKFVSTFPDDPDAPATLFKVGRIQESDLLELHRKRIDERSFYRMKRDSFEKAAAIYARVAESYPDSPYAPRALLREASILIGAPVYRPEDGKRVLTELLERYNDGPEADQARVLLDELR